MLTAFFTAARSVAVLGMKLFLIGLPWASNFIETAVPWPVSLKIPARFTGAIAASIVTPLSEMSASA